MSNYQIPKVYIFGYGDIGLNIIAENQNTYEILGFLDNNSRLWGQTSDTIGGGGY